MHVYAGRLFWPCRSVEVLNIYLNMIYINLNEFEQTKKSYLLHVFKCKFETQVHARACIFRKNDYRSEHLLLLDYHPGKFHTDPFSSFWEHSPTHVKYQSTIIYPSKVIAKVEVFFNISGPNTKVKSSYLLAPTERYWHKKHSCEMSKLGTYQSKDIFSISRSNVKVRGSNPVIKSQKLRSCQLLITGSYNQ